MRRLRFPLQVVLVAIALVAAGALVAACGGTDSSATTATPDSGASASTTPMPAADATAVRDVALGYWAAYNAYDPEKTLSYLDEGYRTSQEETVRNEIGQIKNFGVTLGVSEKSAPVLTAPGQAEMYLTMKTPTGTRTMLMKFTQQGDVWAITFAEEVK